MDDAHKYVERQIAQSISSRPKYWKRDLTSLTAYESSIEPNRLRFLHMIGAVDPRLPVRMER